MKSIANQYRDLKEGKMSQANFMRNLRMSMPQYVTNVTSFNDAVKILKNKRILNEGEISREAELGKIEDDFKSLLAKGYSYSEALELIAQNSGMDPDELEAMLPQDAVDIEGHEGEDDELAAMVAKAEEEEFGPEKYKFQDFPGGISEENISEKTPEKGDMVLPTGKFSDEWFISKVTEKEVSITKLPTTTYNIPIEKFLKDYKWDNETKRWKKAEEFFPRSPIKMAELIAQKHGNELKNLSGRDRQKIALSKAYEEIYYSDHPKANVIAKNLVWGYTDEDWPMNYITALNDILGRDNLEEVQPGADKIEQAIKDKKIDPAVVKAAAEKAMKGDSTDLALLMINAATGIKLEEAKKKKEAKAELHPNQIHPQELRMGIKVELEHTDDLDKAKKIALDHLKENPFYYTALKLSGIESPSAPKVKAPAEKKVKKKKEAVELVDKANAMQKVKMPKDKINEDYESWLSQKKGEEARAKKVMQATNAEGVKFSVNDVVKTPDGKEIKITGFTTGKDGKTKAMYNAGMFTNVYNLDDLEKKSSFRPGVDLGASFDKFKSQLEEIVREVVTEYYDGRDNLDAETEK